MLTTIDNPFDPFTEFDSWFRYDESKGYHSCSFLGRIAKTSNALSDEDQALAIESAIDEIIKYDPLNIYRKAYEKENKKEDTSD
jgi:hypothetical protein